MAPPQGDNVIAETLLALAKDTRYIRYCQSLIEDVLVPFRRTKPADSLFLASLFYAIAVVLRTGKTLGMEACGLEFGRDTRKRRIVSAFITSALWMYALKRWSAADEEDEHVSLTHQDRGLSSVRDTTTTSSLRGDARRRYHEQQRQAMLQRARDADSSSSENGNASSQRTAVNDSVRLYRRMMSRIVQALSANTGPHTLPHDNNDNQHEPADDTISRIGTWAVRLHLAAYLLMGRFPSWMHRLWGMTLQKTKQQRQSLANQPTTYRAVGVLIVLQATAVVVKTVANQSVGLWTQSRRQEALGGPSLRVPHDTTERDATTVSSVTCGICRAVRTHPAVPKSCGHVFCWKCLYQWVSSVRPECPLCRSACRPQDLIALHHYAPK